MSRGLNMVMLIGNATDDPKMYQSKNGSGTQIANFSIACNESRKGPDGNYTEYAEFVRIVCFGKTAEIAGQYVRKGTQLHIQGKLRTREYEKDGQKRYTTEVVCDSMILLGRKSDGQGRQAAPSQGQAPAYGQPAPQYGAQGPAPADPAGHPSCYGPSSYQGGAQAQAPAPQGGYAPAPAPQASAAQGYGYGAPGAGADIPF